MNRSLFLFRRAETYATAGRLDDAVRVAQNLSRSFLSYPGALSMTRLGLLVRLSGLLGKLGAEDALSLAGLGLNRATALGDVLFQSEFLNLIADFGGEDPTALRLEAAHRRQNGLYGVGRNSRKTSGPVETLTEELLQFARED